MTKQKITEYHRLSNEPLSNEQDVLMNTIKEKANEIEKLIAKLQANKGLDQRAIAIAKTDLQTGFMWLNRSVAQSDGF